jgi:uncharacterized membrane protein YtjA (UPF0391 family)
VFEYAMLPLLVALIAGFVGFAGLAGGAGDLTKLLFVLCMAVFVGCMLSEARRSV